MGILWPHSNTVIRTNADARAAGAKIYFFEAGTTTPRTSYQDADLNTPHTHPVIADAHGRAPAIFLDFGDYRERVRTSGDTTLWDTDDIPNPSPIADEDDVDPNAIFQTGDVIFSFRDDIREGFTRCNGRTIGSAISGASERAHSDCEAQFIYLWGTLGNPVCPVLPGGRGSSAQADWAANKTIGMPDLRGAVPRGLDTMGNSAASRFDASVPFGVGNAATAGSTCGLNHHALLTAEAPAHTHGLASVTAVSNGAHTHSVSGSAASNGAHTHSVNIGSGQGAHTHAASDSGGNFWREIGAGGGFGVGGGTNTVTQASTGASTLPAMSGTAASDGAHTHGVTGTAASDGAHTHALTGTMESIGGGGNHNNVSRSMLGTWLMKR